MASGALGGPVSRGRRTTERSSARRSPRSLPHARVDDGARRGRGDPRPRPHRHRRPHGSRGEGRGARRRDLAAGQDRAPRRRPELGADSRRPWAGAGPASRGGKCVAQARPADALVKDGVPAPYREKDAVRKYSRERARSRPRGPRGRDGDGLEAGCGPRARLRVVETPIIGADEERKRARGFPRAPGFRDSES